MNTFIIILNILLFSLIVYNIIGKTNNIIENLVSEEKGSIDACPVEQRNIVFSCDQKMDRLFRGLNSIKQQMPEIDHKVRKQNPHININRRHKTKDGFIIGDWAVRQRRNKKNLSKEKQKKLDSLGFFWKVK